ncbi:ATP-binding protein, partial [Corallococcus carmarthensis]|uniref:ATP-binding protein n=1 Tax=Corallococcus carmarthensis TaxID=2316728 RepID=UPI00148C17AC
MLQETIETLLRTTNGFEWTEVKPARGVEDRVAEAMNWVRTAQHLEPVFGTALQVAASATARRIDFLRIRWEDERRLRHYIQREAQIAAFDDLASTPADSSTWALHYVGKAGVGKTMLVRHLCARISSQNGYWARVDFDHLNPAYPTQAPWLLIEQLAEPLFLQSGRGRVSRSLNWFDKTRLMVRELTGSSTQSWMDVQQTGPWQEMLRAFASVVRDLDGPVFLLFDTCEELAKLSSGDEPANVAATFQLLEDLHREIPRLRVIFFGRRPLASRGAGWRLAGPAHWLPARDFLQLHEMKAFSREEAERYFDQPRERLRSLTPELRQAVLDKTLETSGRSAFVHTRDQPPADSRFNPFEVVLYTDWIREDARVTPQMLARPGNDRYIELRIVERLQHADLLLLLPMVVLLGRFDELLLRDIWSGDPQAFEVAFRELIRQEWVRTEGRQHQVDEGLRPRIEAYLRETQPESIRETARRAKALLEEITIERPVDRVEGFHYILLAELLCDEPERALIWWRKVEKRAVGAGHYGSLGGVCGSLLAEQGPLRHDSPARCRPFRAAVLATYAATLVHRGRPAINEWDEVARIAGDEDFLRIRALLGRLIAENAVESPLDQKRVRRFWKEAKQWHFEDWEESLQAAWVGALEGILEQSERAGIFRLLSEGPLLRTAEWAASSRAPPALGAFALAIVARAFVLRRKRLAQSIAWFWEAASRIRIGSTDQRWLDWRAPQDLGARIRLEMLRSLYPDVLPAAHFLEHGISLFDHWEQIKLSVLDQDRLCTLIIRLEDAVHTGRTERSKLMQRGWRPDQSHYGTPDCNAHRCVPPSVNAYAQARSEEGSPNEALHELRLAAAREERSAHSTLGAMHAEATRLSISRRMRYVRNGGSPEDLVTTLPLEDSEAIFDQFAAAWALEGLRQSNLKRILDPWSRYEGKIPRWIHHCCWRALPVLDEVNAQRALHWAAEHPPATGPGGDFWTRSLELDAVEATLVAQQFQLSPLIKHTEKLESRRWPKAHPSATALRLLLRARALLLPVSSHQLDTLMNKVGPRATARIALDEGELLSLKLPEHGAGLLEIAVEHFRQASDDIGAFLASLIRTIALMRTPGPDLLQLHGELLSTLELLPLTASIRQSVPIQSLSHALIVMADKNEEWRDILVRFVATQVIIEDMMDGGSRFAEMEELHQRYFVARFVPTDLKALKRLLQSPLSNPRAGPLESTEGLPPTPQ